MAFSYTLLAACFVAGAWAQQYSNQQYTTPVPILKQINRHNEDGSYSYGYEAADGTFKIETKYPTGEVYGKYGYVDDVGKVREVEYGATKLGFQPTGNDINVPPPTPNNNNYNAAPLGPNEEDDGQYREDPSVYYKDERYNRPVQAQQQVSRPQQYHQQPQPTYQSQPPTYQPQPQAYQPQPQAYQPQPQAYQQSYQQPAYQQPQQHRFNQQAYLNPAQFATHPAVRNIDYFSGSYSVDYSGKKK